MVSLNPIEFILHVDKYIGLIISNYGILTYAILFLIIFLETGIVFVPFLPGDSLLFVAGAFSSQGLINPIILFAVLTVAAILGDSLNYTIGRYFGERILAKWKLFKPEHLQKTKEFYHKHGGKTIIYARFIPIVRTFAPFVAGIGRMDYKKFLSFNIIGAVVWVGLLIAAGYYFGGLAWVEENLSLIIYLIILASLIPLVIEWIRARMRARKQ
jgi:membrane-associated protein